MANASLDALKEQLNSGEVPKGVELEGGNTAPVSEDGGNNGGENQDVTKEGKKRKRELKKNSDLFNKVGFGDSTQRILPDSPAGKLMLANSQISEIAGFIVPATSKLEIGVSTTTANRGTPTEVSKTSVKIVERFSSTIKGVIINHCPELDARIDDERQANQSDFVTGMMTIVKPDGSTAEVPRKTNEQFLNNKETLTMVTEIKTYEEAVKYIVFYTWFSILEAPAIFYSFTKKTRRKNSEEYNYQEIKSAYDLKGKSKASYSCVNKLIEASEAYKKRKEKAAEKAAEDPTKKVRKPKALTVRDCFPMYSDYRSRKLVVPGNFIAIKKYNTVSPKSSYTAEECKKYNAMYVNPAFGKKTDVRTNKINSLDAESASLVTISGDQVTASKFFAEQNSLVNQTEVIAGVKRWFDRTQFLTLADAKLVKKNEVAVPEKTVNNKVIPATVKYTYDFVEFGTAGNTLQNPEYANIVQATNGRLNDAMVSSFIASLSTRTSKDKIGANRGVIADAAFSRAALEEFLAANRED